MVLCEVRRPSCSKTLALIVMALSALLTGCQSGGVIGAAGKVADVAMEVIGLKKTDQQPRARLVPLRLHASTNLNADSTGRGLSVVVKTYKLKNAHNFLQASYETFLDGTKEKQALGNDLVEIKEILLIPGQSYSSVEKLEPDVTFLGVVALFREPSRQSWRLALASGDIQKTGLTLGVQACAVKLIEGGSAKPTAEVSPLCNK